jgi:ParB/RepB/Spo0J family partition protein
MDLTDLKRIELVSPESIAFDDKNPRGETEEQILQDADFQELRRSVRAYGVLVPLIVRENQSKSQPYKLVDGERRLRAALGEGRQSVPVHVIPGAESDGRVLAYNIHMLRKQWDKKCELNSITEIIEELQAENKDITDAELFKKLKEITNHKEHDLKTLMAMLQYDEATIKKVQEGGLAMSYLVQIESSFVAPFKREFPQWYAKIGDAKLRSVLVKKAEDGKLGNTRYLMDNVLTFFKAPDKARLRSVLKKFIDDPNEPASAIVKRMKAPPMTRRKPVKPTPTKKTKHAEATDVPTEADYRAQLVDIERKVIADGVFTLVFNYLREAIVEFEKRTKARFQNEAELQNFVYSILRTLVASVEFEDPTEKICGKSNRLDFVLKDHKIIVETKYVRDKTHAKKVAEELGVDYLRYKNCPYGQTLLNYIYDPNKYIDNHALYRRDLERLMPDAHHYIQ